MSFAVMATLLTQLVSDRLFEQRTRQDSLSVEKLASMAAPLFSSADTSALATLLSDASAELDGRLLLTDGGGKVQLDAYGELWGTRLNLPEVAQVLGGDALAYGIHPTPEGEYAACCAAQLLYQGQALGALVLVSPVQELMDSLSSVHDQLLRVFVLVAAAALIAALIFSRVITRPIAALTKTIQRMGKGDLSARVKVHATGEIRALAQSYNAMAEQIEHFDQSRSQFVSNASHELKTPLATMKILLENLIYQPDMPPELRAEFMQDMNNEIDRLTSVVTDLLTLSRTDSHETPLNLETVDLSALTHDTLSMLYPAAQKHAQTLEADIQPDVICRCDRSKVGQIIANLTDNAIKYTPDGGEIHVRVGIQDGFARLQVQDNGVGIPQADQAHIFDRFYRVDKARSRATGGTGLGLSIVRQMVAMHGGEVSVASEPGCGSTFTVMLPLRQEVSP